MDRETLFLVDLCARQRGLAAARPAEAGPGFDWARFLDAADRHKVIGLAYRAFAEGRAPAPPPEAYSRLKREASAKAAAKAMLLSEWRRVGAAMSSAGIRALMVKGPALSLQLYGDADAREYRDIDLLVEAGAMDRAAEAFESLGFEAQCLAPDLSPRQRKFLQRNSRHSAYKRKGFPAYFELHGVEGEDIGLAPIRIEEAFARSEILSQGPPIPTLGRADHALVGILHGAYHSWATLQWILDAAVLLIDPSFRLGSESTRAWNDIDPLYTLDAFSVMARRLFDAPSLDRYSPPPGTRTRRALRVSRAHIARLRPGRSQASAYREMVELSRALFMLNRRAVGKARAWSWITTPNAKDLAAFGRAELPRFVYYLARPFLVAFRIGQRLIGKREAGRE